MNKINTAYEDALQLVSNDGIRKSDRTGTGTTSIFGHQMRFNLQDGFPLITTKKVFMRGIAEELFWFINGNTNAGWLQKKKVGIWNEWAPASGDLGPVYGASWRALYAPSEHIIQVLKAIDHNANFVYPYKDENITDENYPERYIKNVYGVGFLGEDRVIQERTYDLWVSLLSRCYNVEDSQYAQNGAVGVTVSPIWHSYEYFAMTLSEAPGYHAWVSGEDLQLNKDYLASDVYSPSTTVFISDSRVEGILPGDQPVVSVNGNKYLTLEASGKTSDEVEYIAPTPGKVWRKRLYIDQVEDVIEQIKNNPDSRRMIVMAWNPPALPDQALPPCHAFFQFYVADGKLSCQLYQRSADMFLGVPFNIASYALLVHMIAQQTDLEVGDFIWTGGDCHIYDNHQEQVKLQLSREAYPFPTLNLKKKSSIFEYSFEDIEIVDYKSHPGIKGEVAV